MIDPLFHTRGCFLQKRRDGRDDLKEEARAPKTINDKPTHIIHITNIEILCGVAARWERRKEYLYGGGAAVKSIDDERQMA